MPSWPTRGKGLADKPNWPARANGGRRYRANVAAAASALQLQNIGAAESALNSAPNEHRNWEWRYFHSQLNISRRVFHAPCGLRAPVLSPDGQRAAACATDPTGEPAPDVFVWETATGKQLHALTGAARSPAPSVRIAARRRSALATAWSAW